jgi:peptidoglycan hydrolase-like protein with peptidoglycan-binding domain
MNPRILFLGITALLVQFSVHAATPFTSIHPEEAYPNDAPPLASAGDHAPLFKAVQERLLEEGFDGGPANGNFGAKTQAALAQFQLSRNLPVSGALDVRTLDELGVDLEVLVNQAEGDSASAAAGR